MTLDMRSPTAPTTTRNRRRRAVLARLRGRNLTRTRPPPISVSGVTRELVAYARFELVPMKALDGAIAELPPKSRVSITCSPARGIDATLDVTARLLDDGHDAVPHLSARLVEGPEHVARIASWLRDHGMSEIFVIAGDAQEPHGPYDGAVPFLRELLERDQPVRHVGVAAYPDGHSFISRHELHDALHAKQELLGEAGVAGTATTQMCFDARRIRDWLRAERSDGLTMPVCLGIPGVVDRTRLMTMGARVGVGASLRYVSKNRTSVKRMLAPGGYDPTQLLEQLAADAYGLGITGLHSFTFNSVADTLTWQRTILASD